MLSDSRDQRPATVVVGAGIALLRAVWYAVTIVLVLAGVDNAVTRAVSADSTLSTRVTTAVVLVVALLIDLILALRVLSGHSWARLILMAACAVTAAAGLLSALRHSEEVTVSVFPILGGSILVLLALSSPRSREWSSRRARRVEEDGA